MKYLIILFSLLMIGCTGPECSLAQIPPQVIIAGSNCTAPLPDYRNKITVTGGCSGFTVSQSPAPGTVLTATNKTVNVIIRAVGSNLKTSQVNFSVTMIDTVTPKIVPLDEFFSTRIIQINEIYTLADVMFKDYTAKFDSVFPWNNFPGLKEKVDSSDMRNLWVDSLNVPLRKFPQ